ncbi:MAG: TolC family protein, partial [Bradymonadaceae bacterium]
EESRVEAESTVTEARSALVQARGKLASLMGRSAMPLEEWSVRGELLPDDLPELGTLVERIEQRPALAELEAEARAEAKRQKALARSVVPTPTVTGGYKRVDTPAGGSLNGMMIGVLLDLPVFNQNGGQREAVAARRARLEAQAKLRRRGATTQLRAAFRSAQLRLEAARTYRKQAIPRVEDLLERARQRQESGVGSLFGLVDAHRTVYETKIRAVERAWKARSAVIEVEKYAGGLP